MAIAIQPLTGKVNTPSSPKYTGGAIKPLTSAPSTNLGFKAPAPKPSFTPIKLASGLKVDLTAPTQIQSPKLNNKPSTIDPNNPINKTVQEQGGKIIKALTQSQTGQQVSQLMSDPLSLKVMFQKGAVGTLAKTKDDYIKGITTSINQAALDLRKVFTNDTKTPPTTSQRIGAGLKATAETANAVLSPLTSLFGAANNIPVVGSISKEIGIAFSALGEGATEVSNAIVESLPIPKQTKSDIKVGMGEIFALAAQIAVGGKIGKDTKAELVSKFGEQDAATIVIKAQELAKEPTKSEFTPQEVKDSVINNKLTDTQEGKSLLKTAIQAEKEGKNIQVGEPSIINKLTSKSTDELSTYIKNQGGRTPEQIDALREDIKENGITTPVEVTKRLDNSYQIDDGTHRIQIAKELGIKDIPTKVREEVLTKPSKIGKSIEAKAVEEKLTSGFGKTAGYEPITLKEQATKATDLVNKSFEDARAIVRGEKPLPSDLKGTALITAMEEHIKKNPDADLAYELANSPLVSGTSQAAQELRLAAERQPDSATARLAEIKAAREAKVKNIEGIKKSTIDRLKTETKKINLKKDDLVWDKFLKEIQC